MNDETLREFIYRTSAQNPATILGLLGLPGELPVRAIPLVLRWAVEVEPSHQQSRAFEEADEAIRAKVWEILQNWFAE